MSRLLTPSRLVAIVAGFAIVMWATITSSAPPANRVPPPAPLSTAIICRPDEPGERLLIVGTVVNSHREPVAGATIAVYNTDARGLYNPPNSPTREPRINGKVTTDEQGRFQVLTVRPAPYPDNSDPAHVHLDALAAGYGRTYTAIWFEGDPLITPAALDTVRRRSAQHPNEFTKVERASNRNGVLTVEHTIALVDN